MPKWYELTYPSFGEIRDRTQVAVMITGALEGHGHHLPLGTDTILPTYLGDKIAAKTSALVLPPIPFGDSWIFRSYSGTITVSPMILTEFYQEIMCSVFENGLKYIVVLNGHGGNVSAINHAAELATKEGEGTVVVVNWWRDLAKDARRQVLETPEGHAAEDETSEVMFVRPDLVKMDEAVAARVITKFRIISGLHSRDLVPSAMHGEPETASAKKGETIMVQAELELIKLITQLENDELPIDKD